MEKFGITVFCVKGSGEPYGTRVRTKAAVSEREIKPFPVKASGPGCRGVGLSPGLHRVGRRCFQMHTQGPTRVNTLRVQLFTFRRDPKDLGVLKANTGVCFYGLGQERHQNNI